jgi:hypothetical protein
MVALLALGAFILSVQQVLNQSTHPIIFLAQDLVYPLAFAWF